ncbi:MAG: AI-2E family transporter [Lachnospiraceae bacterium]
MEWNKNNMKNIMVLIVFTVLVLAVVWNYTVLLKLVKFVLNILSPFLLGGALAFILNVPMSFIERRVFKNSRMKDKKISQKLGRPVSMLCAILFAVGIVVLVVFVVAPELANTIVSLGGTIQVFIPKVQKLTQELFRDNPDIVAWIGSFQFDWNHMVQSMLNFLKNGAGSFLNSTFSVAKVIVNGLMDFFIAFVFSCYILLQKEKLGVQIRKVMYALLPEHAVTWILEVEALTYKTFSSFLTGQCVEAVILGSMFFVAMSVLRFPYALLVGVLVAFTALIPIFGAFIGCAVGTFLILMVNPMQALGFLALFLVLQQIEGNLIYPHVVGESVGLPSIWVLVAVSLGASLMGIVGMLVFIPLVSVVYSLFRGYIYKKLKEKEITVK